MELPPEILHMVLLLADVKAKFILRQTCTRLFNEIDYKDFVIYFAQSKQLPDIAKVFSRYKKPISLSFKKSINLEPSAINSPSKLTNLTALSLDISVKEKEVKKDLLGLNRLTNLQRLTFKENTNYAKALKSLTQLTRLYMHSCPRADFPATFNGRSCLLEVDLGKADINSLHHIASRDKLTSLKFASTTVANGDTFQLLIQASSLKSLDVTSSAELLDFFPLPTPLMMGTLTTLESLRLEYYPAEQIERCVGLTKLSVIELTIQPMNKSNWTSLTQLKSIEMGLRDNTVHEVQFMNALPHLHELTVHRGKVSFNAIPQTLTRLELNDLIDFKAGELTRLVNLKKLKMNECTRAPGSDLTFHCLTSMTDLTQLELINMPNGMFSLTCITCMTNLKEFKMEFAYGMTEFANIDYSRLPNLESLSVPIITAHSLKLLSAAKLTKLEVKDNFEMDLNIVQELPLRVLHVECEQNDEFWQKLVHVTRLESLRVVLENSVHANLAAQEAKLASLTTMRHLTNLELYRVSQINAKCLTGLTSLQRLTVPLRPREITDKLFVQCVKLKKTMPNLYSIETYWDGDYWKH